MIPKALKKPISILILFMTVTKIYGVWKLEHTYMQTLREWNTVGMSYSVDTPTTGSSTSINSTDTNTNINTTTTGIGIGSGIISTSIRSNTDSDIDGGGTTDTTSNGPSDETAGDEDTIKADSIDEEGVSGAIREDDKGDENDTSNDTANGVTIDNNTTSMITGGEKTIVATTDDNNTIINTTTTTNNNNNNNTNEEDKEGENEDNNSNVKSSIPISEASDVYIFPEMTTINQIETFDDFTNQVNLHDNLPIPRDLNILFMGDSLTRYQYLDLVYFLKYGKWVDPADYPNLVVERTHRNWNKFFHFTNDQLKPYEQCDCYRPEKGVLSHRRSNQIENRYFRHEEMNNTVTYLQKFGDDFVKSSWNVSDVHNPHTLVTELEDYKPIQWLNWVESIKDFVCKMEPKPSVFIFNSGLWKNDDLTNLTLQGEIVEAVKQCDILSMFKTTTKIMYVSSREIEEHEKHLCNQTDYCLDLTWTGMIGAELYWDAKLHFKPPVYSYMNLELLSILSSIPPL